jgi:hypothetical protein
MNSSIEMTEAVKLADKLIARTREGKLPWEAAGIMAKAFTTTDVSGARAFTTTLEGNLKATVSTMKSGQDEQLAFSLVEFDPHRVTSIAGILFDKSPMPPAIRGNESLNPDKDVLSVSVEKDPPLGYDTAEERHLAGLLIDLYGLARRSALKIDGSVEKALTYLDRIAV